MYKRQEIYQNEIKTIYTEAYQDEVETQIEEEKSSGAYTEDNMLIKENNLELDLNVSGLRKPYCGEVYVSGYLKELADEYG